VKNNVGGFSASRKNSGGFSACIKFFGSAANGGGLGVYSGIPLST